MKQLYILAIALIAGLSTTTNAQTYMTPPFSEGWESGSIGAMWTTASSDVNGEIWVSPIITSTWGDATPHTGTYFLGMHQSQAGGGTYNLNEAWLHLDLSSTPQLDFEFWWAEFNDETEIQDGVFISDDGGTTFIKVVDLDGAAATDLQWYQYTYDLDSMVAANGLSMSSTFVIKFQQYDNYYMAGGNDGFLFDDISIQPPLSCANSTASFTETVCESYTVPSGDETYTTSGIYNDTIANMSGCDSIMTIDVTILAPTTASITETACGSYTVPSGDETYTTSGIYNDTIPNGVSCDSVITIDVTINTVSYTTSQTGNTLSVTATGATYQWVDCNNGNSPIAGATSANYTATSNGSYAVEVTQNGCTETSTCMTVAGIGFGDNQEIAFNLFPNPNSGVFTLQIGNEIVNLSIYNNLGQLIYSENEISNSSEIDLGNIPAGFYTLRLSNSTVAVTSSFVVK